MGPIKNLVGQKFGMLTVIKYLGANKHGESRYLCVCECGNTREALRGKLKQGEVFSCGCSRRYKSTHHMSNTRLFTIWRNIKQRCDSKNKTNPRFKYYAGRGIAYCKEWERFEPFMEWALSNGYTDDLQIDRIDSNGDYCPENCRFVTRYENVMNRNITRRLTINGVEKTVVEWCKEGNINYDTLLARIGRGWPPYDAVFAPVLVKNRKKKRNETKIA